MKEILKNIYYTENEWKKRKGEKRASVRERNLLHNQRKVKK